MLLAVECDLAADDVDDVVVPVVELSADSRPDPAIPEKGPELSKGMLGKAAAGDELVLGGIQLKRRLDGGAVEGVLAVAL